MFKACQCASGESQALPRVAKRSAPPTFWLRCQPQQHREIRHLFTTIDSSRGEDWLLENTCVANDTPLIDDGWSSVLINWPAFLMALGWWWRWQFYSRFNHQHISILTRLHVPAATTPLHPSLEQCPIPILQSGTNMQYMYPMPKYCTMPNISISTLANAIAWKEESHNNLIIIRLGWCHGLMGSTDPLPRYR